MKANIFKCIWKYFTNTKFRFVVNSSYLRLYDKLSDRRYIELEYKSVMGKELNIDNPVTYSEKLQWLKLHVHKSEYTTMVDKYAVKEFVANKIGAEYCIPTIGVWDNCDDIDFDKLPNQFVLKCNHDSGSIIICKDKQNLDYLKIKKKLKKYLKRNYYLAHREWPYKDVKRKIICEPFLKDNSTNSTESWLVDYKFFCFNGEPKICYISKDRAQNPTTDFFDMEFNHLPFKMKDPNSDILPSKPIAFDKMKELAKKLCVGIPHLRVDFYYVNNQIYVGELTFYHCAGFVQITPDEWNYKLGKMITLPMDK